MADHAYFSLRLKETQFHFWRLTNGEENFLRRNSVPMQIDSSTLWDLKYQERWDAQPFTLARTFLILERLFGKSSNWIDDWKGTFSFPLLLKVEKPNHSFFYMTEIYDNRGSLYFSLYRIIPTGVSDRSAYTYQEPIETEFSSSEIKAFIILVYGFLKDASYFVAQRHTQPFLKYVKSEHVIYGYRDGRFFEEEIESESELEASIANFESVYGKQIQEQLTDDIQAMIREITQATPKLPEGQDMGGRFIRTAIAQNLLLEGFDCEMTAHLTELPMSEIQQIQVSINAI
jgi:hypothetical protein